MVALLIAILLFSVGSALLVAELFIPAHGLTAGLGLLAVLSGVIACFFVGEWVGVGVLASTVTLGPLAASGFARRFAHAGRPANSAPGPGGPDDSGADAGPDRAGRRCRQRTASIGCLRISRSAECRLGRTSMFASPQFQILGLSALARACGRFVSRMVG